MASEQPDPPPPVDLRLQLEALIAKWREQAAEVATCHATLGIGWGVCANDLEALLAAAPQRHCRYCGWRGHDVLQAGLDHELCPTCQERLPAPQRQEPPSHE